MTCLTVSFLEGIILHASLARIDGPVRAPFEDCSAPSGFNCQEKKRPAVPQEQFADWLHCPKGEWIVRRGICWDCNYEHHEQYPHHAGMRSKRASWWNGSKFSSLDSARNRRKITSSLSPEIFLFINYFKGIAGYIYIYTTLVGRQMESINKRLPTPFSNDIIHL